MNFTGRIKLVGILDEDFINYKVPSMSLMFPNCTFKCGSEFCQNSALAHGEIVNVGISEICCRYLKNPITESIVCQGLEPFDSFDELYELIWTLRIYFNCSDDVVIYTGYNKDEIADKIEKLQMFASNVVVKFGRFIPSQEPHFDKVLGVNLASDNQYAERIT